MSPSPEETARRGATVWALVITGSATFMAALDNLVVTTALPAIRDDLGGGLEELEWIVNAYTLPFAVLLLLGAVLGDRFGAGGFSPPVSLCSRPRPPRQHCPPAPTR